MKHKPKDDVEKSLRENITLLTRRGLDQCIWATYEEIKPLLQEGFEIFNDEKRELFHKNS